MSSKPLLVALVLLALGGVYLLVQANWLQVTRHVVAAPKLPGSFTGFKILHLSDLHGKMFGANNRRLAAVITAVQPHTIVATGDMISSTRDDGTAFVKLARQLSDRIPFYYIPGNHELALARKTDGAQLSRYRRYIEELKAAGVVLLDDEMVSVNHNPNCIPGKASPKQCNFEGVNEKEQIIIAGFTVPMGYYWSARGGGAADRSPLDKAAIARRLPPPPSDRFTLLLAHDPKHFSAYAAWGADLVLAGHTHGGMIRLPFLGGALSPDRTFFPKYDAGSFQAGGAVMVVSRGLGSSRVNLRVGNRPEVVVIELQKR